MQLCLQLNKTQIHKSVSYPHRRLPNSKKRWHYKFQNSNNRWHPSFRILMIDVTSIHTKYEKRCRLLRTLIQWKPFVRKGYHGMFKEFRLQLSVFISSTSVSMIQGMLIIFSNYQPFKRNIYVTLIMIHIEFSGISGSVTYFSLFCNFYMNQDVCIVSTRYGRNCLVSQQNSPSQQNILWMSCLVS